MFSTGFDSSSEQPLYQQLYNNIKADIENGRIKGKLPSKTKVAERLKISKVTVESAYEQLKAEGYIYSKPRSGYYVNIAFDSKLHHNELKRQIFAEEQEKIFVYDLKTYAVAPKSFPFATWSKLMRKVLTDEGEKLLDSTPHKGIWILREQIAKYLYDYRGIIAYPEQIIIGAGTETLLSMTIQLLGMDSLFAMENPGYGKVRKIFASHGVSMSPIGMVDDGIDIEQLKATNADVVHITPSHHFPLGTVMPIKKRLTLLELADLQDFYIIEDDYDSEFRFQGRPIPALKGLDNRQRVIYINTFAKSLAPSMRISYMVLPPLLLEKYQKELSFYSCTVPAFEQYTLAHFMEGGYFERHLSRMKTVYKAKNESLISALEQSSFADRLTISGKNVGLHFLLRLSGGLSEQDMVERARVQGINVAGLSEFYCDGNQPPPQTVVIGYSKIADENIPELVKMLEKAWIR